MSERNGQAAPVNEFEQSGERGNMFNPWQRFRGSRDGPCE